MHDVNPMSATSRTSGAEMKVLVLGALALKDRWMRYRDLGMCPACSDSEDFVSVGRR
jgi:hypothetical protein